MKIATSAEIRSRAWSAMSATWSTVLSVTCAISLISYVVSLVTSAIPGVGELLSLAATMFLSILTLGLVNGMLGYLRGRFITFDCIQSMLPCWKQALIFTVWMFLCIMGWMMIGFAISMVGGFIGRLLDSSGTVSMLLALLGLIVMLVLLIRALLDYSVAQCVFVDNPNIGARNALRRSKEMMHGYRWHYVKVQFPVYLMMIAISVITSLLANVLPTLAVTLIGSILAIAPNVMMRYFEPVMYDELQRIGR